MDKYYREGKINHCFLLPEDISADLRQLAIDRDITLQDLLTELVLNHLYSESTGAKDE